MQQLTSARDFMLIARSTRGDEKFHARIGQVVDLAKKLYPTISWRAQFELGPREHVEVFSAGDSAIARQVSRLLGALQDVKAELAPLRSGW